MADPVVLIVDDNEDNRFTLSMRLEACGCENIVTAKNGREALEKMRQGPVEGLRIPKDVAQRIGLRAGARVDVEAEDGRIIISPARPRYVLADLLKGMTPEAMREAFDWGPDRGREIVE
jgi:antitoxin MazE